MNQFKTSLIKTYTRVVTPRVAEEMLQWNLHNRPISKTNITRLAASMLDDDWVYAGDPIRFSTEGILLDGQHRLLAIIQSNVTVELLIITGLLPEIYDKIDQGAPRQLGQILSSMGVKNSNVIAASLPYLHSYNNTKSLNRQFFTKLSKHKQLEIYYKYEQGLEEAGTFASSSGTIQKRFTGGMTCFMYYTLNQLDHNDTIKFMKALKTGDQLLNVPQAILLREKIISFLDRPEDSRPGHMHKCALLFKSWNAFRHGKTIKRLSISKNEKFPLAI